MNKGALQKMNPSIIQTALMFQVISFIKDSPHANTYE